MVKSIGPTGSGDASRFESSGTSITQGLANLNDVCENFCDNSSPHNKAALKASCLKLLSILDEHPLNSSTMQRLEAQVPALNKAALSGDDGRGGLSGHLQAVLSQIDGSD